MNNQSVIRAKNIRKAARQAKNEPPVRSVGEEIFNAISHGVGAGLAIAAMVLLLLRSDTPARITASLFYGISMIAMMLMSCIYHSMPTSSRIKRICRRFDYSSIYLLIGGTFAPIYLVYQGGTAGVVLFCIQWAIILFGVSTVCALGPGCLRPLHFTLYFLIGWSGLMYIPTFVANNLPLLWFILIGGLAYTIGMIPFARNKKYDHCVWHLFVLAGALFQWIGIYNYLY